ncbi:transglycosylase SLT domain-containing protein [Limisalsivibrio acetivorans]|uniref:transglycosylase SLT domain-containing protein n=1 Tax=Limisalsivibrio acetivorans TaxID=1304888 RepID=UPI0003B3ACF5|nr:murein transglycosylase domain-containing protein [Limisalsivibrio acetivorans]
MKRVLVLLLIFCSQFSFADDFGDFMKEMDKGYTSQQDDFETYNEDIKKEFERYKRIVDEEFEAYKKEIALKWSSPEMTGPKKWVEYKDDMTARRSVDFDAGEFTIEIIAESIDGIEAEFEGMLKDMLSENYAEAYERDKPAKRIEKRAEEEIGGLLKGSPDESLVIGSAITGKDNPNSRDIEEATGKLLKGAEVNEKPSKIPGKKVYVLKGKLPKGIYAAKAREIAPIVRRYASKYSQKPSLIFAVIHTESAFNPMARSHIPAYGLMQIVPKSAGVDVAKYLTGKQTILAPSYLYDREKNIEAGATYLHILSTRYLRYIDNSLSRLYCAIAAYNTGSGNVALAFNGRDAGRYRYSAAKAAKKVNRMTPEQVYSYLRNNLTYAEARSYIAKVTSLLPKYSYFD